MASSWEARKLAYRLAWEVLDAWRATVGDGFATEAARPGEAPLDADVAAAVGEEFRKIAARMERKAWGD